MIWQEADGWHLQLWFPGGQVWQYGPYPSWATAFAVRRRLDHVREEERQRGKLRRADERLLAHLEEP